MAKWLDWAVLCGVLGGMALSFGENAVALAQDTQATASPESETEVQVVMNGDSFKTDMKNGTYTWIGNARFIRGSDSVFSDELILYMPAGQVEKATAKGNVRILTQEVTAAGDQGTFYLDEQKVELEGHAKASQGNNSITAHRIVAWLAEGNAVEGYGSRETERVIMTMYSEPVEQPAAETPETDATEGTPPETIPETPPPPSLIVIESDTLQYNAAQAYAMFTGTVNAQQNDMAIQADEMRVYLATSEDAGSDIDRIEVAGNVHIVQKDNVITGAEGVFDQANQSAIIKGTADQQARAENSTKKSILNADSIIMLLESDDIQADGNVIFETMMSQPAAEANP